MLFKNYATIDYKIGGRTVTLVDIFRNIAFINIEDSQAFEEYYIQEGETPETVSLKLYGSTDLSWLVLLVNNYNSIKDEWFLSPAEEFRRRETAIGGKAYYISALPDINPGDIIIKVTGTGPDGATGVDINTYQHIVDFDPYFRKIRGICGSGTLNDGDLVLFARQNTDNGTVNPISFLNQEDPAKTTDYTQISFVENYQDSPLYFYSPTNNVVIDPYRYSVSGITSINSDTLYSNTTDTTTENNFARCILYRYGVCGGNPPDIIEKKTLAVDTNTKYLAKQKITVLKRDYVRTVVIAIENALKSDAIGKRIRVEV